MIKVLYIGMSDRMGGIESFVINTYRKINKNEIQIDFLKYSNTICFENEFLENGSKVFWIPHRGEKLLRHYIFLFKFFLNHKDYDIVHYHLNTASCISAIVLALMFRIKVIAHSHNTLQPKLSSITGVLNFINRIILSFLPITRVACSIAAGKQMFKGKKFEFIKNGIDVEKYKFNENKRKLLRKKLQIENDIVFGHIGAIKTQKNHDLLIDIFSLFKKKNPSAKLILVGDGDLRSAIEKKVESLELTESVLFLGVRSDIPDLLNVFDVFIFPSLYEGLPFALIEAQASGLQCVVSDKIPKDVFITNQVHSMPLSAPIFDWVMKIEEVMRIDRIKNVDQIVLKGFDSLSVARQLEVIYNEKTSS